MQNFRIILFYNILKCHRYLHHHQKNTDLLSQMLVYKCLHSHVVAVLLFFLNLAKKINIQLALQIIIFKTLVLAYDLRQIKYFECKYGYP